MSEFKVVTSSFVSVIILKEGDEYGVEKRFAKDTQIDSLKNKLELITGYLADDMKLKVLSKDKKFICDLDDESKMLGFYPIEDGNFLLVEATRSLVPNQEDPNFKRFELTSEEYEKKRGTMKEFKEMHRLGRFSDQYTEANKSKEKMQQEKYEKEKQASELMKIDDRCQVRLPGAPTRLGTVKYVGQLENKPGYFIGIKYDEPLGKNDGSVDGKRYFECLPNYGGFVKPENVTVGDFPEENFDDEI